MSKTSNDAAQLKAIDRRHEAARFGPSASPTGAAVVALAKEDLDSFLQIEDPDYQRHAVGVMAQNQEEIAGYRVALEGLLGATPDVAKRIEALHTENTARELAKTERKNAEYLDMCGGSLIETADANRPSAQQLEAVKAFRDKSPRGWKERLGIAWMTGRYPGATPEHAALLQQVRNNFGPEWLTQVTPRELNGDSQVPAVDTGVHIGPVTAVSEGRVSQKTGRHSTSIVFHEASKLSGATPAVGAIAQISYKDGVGTVAIHAMEKAHGLGR